jgi:antitoxin VapB
MLITKRPPDASGGFGFLGGTRSGRIQNESASGYIHLQPIIEAMKIQAVDIQNISGQQAIQLPNDLRIIPFHNPWQNFYDSLSGFSDDFMNERNQPPQQNCELFD